MSLPTFPNADKILDREEALNAILTSIAMEEAALSHLLNAEGEKIEYAIEHVKYSCKNSDLKLLLAINNSAAQIIENIGDMQIILKQKMQHALCHLHADTSSSEQARPGPSAKSKNLKPSTPNPQTGPPFPPPKAAPPRTD